MSDKLECSWCLPYSGEECFSILLELLQSERCRDGYFPFRTSPYPLRSRPSLVSPAGAICVRYVRVGEGVTFQRGWSLVGILALRLASGDCLIWLRLFIHKVGARSGRELSTRWSMTRVSPLLYLVGMFVVWC